MAGAVSLHEPADEPPIHDDSRLDELRAALGAAGVGRLMRVLADTLPAARARLESALAAGDRAEARRAAHALKSMTGQMGFLRASAAMGALQAADDAALDPASWAPLAARLLDEVAAAAAARLG